MEPPAGSRRTVSCHGMRVSLYLPFVLLCALLMSACGSEELEAQQAREVRKTNAMLVSIKIEHVVDTYAAGVVSVECPDTVDKIVRLGCEATAGDGGKRLRIKVARLGEGHRREESFSGGAFDDSGGLLKMVTKVVNTAQFEQNISDSLGHKARPRTRGLLTRVECPALVEEKKGVWFVCKGEGVSMYGRHTVRVRAGFSDDSGKLTVSRVQIVPPLP